MGVVRVCGDNNWGAAQAFGQHPKSLNMRGLQATYEIGSPNGQRK